MAIGGWPYGDGHVGMTIWGGHMGVTIWGVAIWGWPYGGGHMGWPVGKSLIAKDFVWGSNVTEEEEKRGRCTHNSTCIVT